MFAVGTTVNEQGLPEVLRGRRATLHFSSGQNQVDLKPERPFAEELEADRFSSDLPLASIPRHHKNWYDCIRTGKVPNAPIDLGIRAHTALCLGEMAERLSLTLLFDEATRTVRTGEGKVLKPLGYDSVVPAIA
jgi:hypothetical protein